MLSMIEDNDYKYKEVMKSLGGGSFQFYLPHRGQTVFAAFLNRDKNPHAPEYILVGSAPRVARAGAILSRQSTPIPVFIKKSTDCWQYKGRFTAVGIASSKKTSALANKARRRDVAFALQLRKADSGPSTSSVTTFMEGACGQVTRNVYERDNEARAACLEHHGHRCCVCGLDFGDEYGERGTGYIHVHHLLPLHSRKGPSLTDAVVDLCPVCANCHMMLHAGGELISPEQLRSLYWSEASVAARRSRLEAGQLSPTEA